MLALASMISPSKAKRDLITLGHPDAWRGCVRLMEWEGDSMEPSLRRGDLVFLDTSDRLPSPPGIFAWHNGFGEVLNRLELVPDTSPPLVRISSDNARYPNTYMLPLGDLKIIGRYRCRITA